MAKKTEYVYVAYSHDKYQLPIAVCDSLKALAEFLERTPASVASAIAQGSPYVARVYIGN